MSWDIDLEKVVFKSHPYYDQSDASDWLYLRPEDWTELEPGPLKVLHDTLRSEKDRLCALALDRILAAGGEKELAERPYPEVNEYLFHPIGDYGYRVYVEIHFFYRPNEASPDSDFWWAIFDCPYELPPSPTRRREEYIIGLGWIVA